MNLRRLLLLGLSLAVVAGCTPAGGSSDTPEQVLERANEALASGDFKTYVSLLTPETLDAMAPSWVLAGMQLEARKSLTASLPISRENKEQLDRARLIYEQHGLSSLRLKQLLEIEDDAAREKAIQQAAAEIPDKPGFLAKFMALSGHARGQSVPTVGEVKSVEVSGDRAAATTVSRVGGTAFEIEIELKKTSGGWRIDLTDYLRAEQ
jgi:hypothetical protein